MSGSADMWRRFNQPSSLSTRRRLIVMACVAEVLLIALGVFAETTLHHIVVLIIAAIFAMLLIIAVPVLRRMGRI